MSITQAYLNYSFKFLNRGVFSILILIVISFFSETKGQIIVQGKELSYLDYVEQDFYDSLYEANSGNKEIPEKFSLQILFALAHYPELKDVKITFLVKKAFTPLSALPSLSSMMNPLGERSYRVVISSESVPEMERILLKNLPINAQIGVIGHEIAHVLDYHKKSFTDLLAVALNYSVNPVYHAWFEKSTDLRTIEHGLGWELYSYSKYVRTLFGSEQREVNLSDDFYLHFNEILFEMQKRSSYDHYFQPNSIIKK